MSTFSLDEQAQDFYTLYKNEGLTPRIISRFRHIIMEHFRLHRRSLPWRDSTNPYHILVSEVMLQQTQVPRVIDVYNRFIAAFPDFAALAKASLRDVLLAWQGLGYNRRAIALHKIAGIVMSTYGGSLPSDPAALRTLPGIGPYTSCAVAAFAFNRPTIFIETNVRAVYFAFFFRESTQVNDTKLVPLVEQTLARECPRDWYHAIFDYGTALKKEANPISRSAHYKRQSPFKGSNREVRSAILRFLLTCPNASEEDIISNLKVDAERVKSNLADLAEEGFITHDGDRLRIA